MLKNHIIYFILATLTLCFTQNTFGQDDTNPTECRLPLFADDWDEEDWNDLLYFATEFNQIKNVEKALKCGADPDTVFIDTDSQTVLHIAAFRGYTDIVRLLLRKGANPNASDVQEFTPLHFAAANGHMTIVTLLLLYHADSNPINFRVYTPLHFAAKEGHTEIVKILLQYRADPHTQNIWRDIPLQHAAEEGHLETARTLIEHMRRPTPWDEISLKAALNVMVQQARINPEWTALIEIFEARTQIKAYRASDDNEALNELSEIEIL